jgi:hypothetical protein
MVNSRKKKKKVSYVLSRAKNSGRQCYFKIWLDCHKFKKKSVPNYAHVKKMSKKLITSCQLTTANHNGAFSIVSNHDFDDQFFFARDSILNIW